MILHSLGNYILLLFTIIALCDTSSYCLQSTTSSAVSSAAYSRTGSIGWQNSQQVSCSSQASAYNSLIAYDYSQVILSTSFSNINFAGYSDVSIINVTIGWISSVSIEIPMGCKESRIMLFTNTGVFKDLPNYLFSPIYKAPTSRSITIFDTRSPNGSIYLNSQNVVTTIQNAAFGFGLEVLNGPTDVNIYLSCVSVITCFNFSTGPTLIPTTLPYNNTGTSDELGILVQQFASFFGLGVTKFAVGLAVICLIFIISISIAAFAAYKMTGRKRRWFSRKRNSGSGDESYIEEKPSDDIWITDVEIGTIIGSGNYGTVYKGTWNGVNVACKQVESPGNTLLQEEAMILKELSHPNIIQFFGLFKRKELEQFMIMEYAEALDLRTQIKDIGAMIYTYNLISIAIDIAGGMVYLGQRELVHRDIALRNIFLYFRDASYKAKVGDFGKCKKMENGVYNGSSNDQISIKNSAPESCSNTTREFTSKSDVFSYGLLLYSLFSKGRSLLKGLNTTDILLLYKSGNPLSIEEWQPKTPETIQQITVECLNMNPKNRPTFNIIVSTLTQYRDSISDDTTPKYIIPLHTKRDSSSDGEYGSMRKVNTTDRKISDVSTDSQYN